MKGEEGTRDPEGVGTVEATPVLRLYRKSLRRGVVLHEAGDLGRSERYSPESPRKSRASWLSTERALASWPTLASHCSFKQQAGQCGSRSPLQTQALATTVPCPAWSVFDLATLKAAVGRPSTVTNTTSPTRCHTP